MITYCTNCGQAISYTLKEPDICPHCKNGVKSGLIIDTTSKSSASKVKQEPAKPTLSGKELEEYLEWKEYVRNKNKGKTQKIKKQEEEDEDDFDEEDDDLDDQDEEEYDYEDEDGEEARRVNRRSSARKAKVDLDGLIEIEGIQKTRGESLKDLAAMPPENIPAREPSKEKFNKSKFLKQFKAENSNKVEKN